MINWDTARDIETVQSGLHVLANTGTKSVVMNVDAAWFLILAYVLDVKRVSIFDTSRGRVVQSHGAIALTYEGMHVTINTGNLADQFPPDADEAYLVIGTCPNCGDLAMMASGTPALALAAAEQFGFGDLR
jgi:hypothetical protein